MSASRELRSLRITARDRAILCDVALHGAASRVQLKELGHFGSPSRANRVLGRLANAKYLRRAYVATGPKQNATIYVIGPNGASIAVEDCALDPVEMRRHGQRRPERMYLEHHLGVLAIRLIARKVDGELRLSSFFAEPECRHEYEVFGGARRIRRFMKPDAMILFAWRDEALPIFIEFDRGNTSLPQMANLFSRYGAYWTDQAFQSAYELDSTFTVAVVTTAGSRRIDHLLCLTAKLAVPVKFTTLGQLESDGFAAPIWRSLQSTSPTTLWDAIPSGGGS